MRRGIRTMNSGTVRTAWALLLGACVTLGATVVDAEPQRGRKVAVTRPVPPTACAVDQGAGVKTNRRFCDVIIASTAHESVSVTLPPHTGPAAIMFDLHNRFIVPPQGSDAAQAFSKQTALISIIRLTGEVIDRAAVSREFRSAADLFDRVAGGGRGAPPKLVAPGQAQPVRVTIPVGVDTIGIVGTRLEEWRASGRGASDAPNKPIAMVSNLRIEYTPR